MSEKPTNEQPIRKIKCAVCNFEVRDSEDQEVLTVIQAHAKRKHDKEFTVEQLRPFLAKIEGESSA